MISLTGAVSVILYLVIAGLIFGLLWWLVGVVVAQFPGAAPFMGVARVILAILAVLVLIGILLSLVSERPIFRP